MKPVKSMLKNLILLSCIQPVLLPNCLLNELTKKKIIIYTPNIFDIIEQYIIVSSLNFVVKQGLYCMK